MKGWKFMKRMKNFIFINPWSTVEDARKRVLNSIPKKHSFTPKSLLIYILKLRPIPTHISILSIPFSIVVLARACSGSWQAGKSSFPLPPSKNFIVIIHHHFPSLVQPKPIENYFSLSPHTSRPLLHQTSLSQSVMFSPKLFSGMARQKIYGVEWKRAKVWT